MKHEVRKQETRVDQSDRYSCEIDGYEVLVVRDDNRTEINIVPKDWSHIRLGIIRMCPKSVEDVEKFAAISESLLTKVAAELRAEGLDDLRSEHERRMDELTAQFVTR